MISMHKCLAWLLSVAYFTGALAASKPAAESLSSDTDQPSHTPNLAVKVSTAFPQSEIFGVKLVNGHPTQARLEFINEETSPVSVAFIGGSLWGPDPKTKGETSIVIRNITSTRYNVQIPAGEKESISYSFATELHPQDLRLNLVAVITNDAGGVYSLSAYNETVSVVEPDASFFDLQLIFLYLLLTGIFFGSCYFIYNTWIAALFPQKSRNKPSDRTKRSAGASKKADLSEQTPTPSIDGPVVATGAKPYDESWIPEHHINRPEAKRVKTGGGRPKSRGKPE